MMYFLLSLLISSALAQNEPCAPPDMQCPLNSCTRIQMCVDASGCTHDQVFYQQDCTATPRPNYCPPGNEQKPVFMLRDRKTCPPK
jgi:hypothetical protein